MNNNPLYPNGRCDRCGHGLNLDTFCGNLTCEGSDAIDVEIPVVLMFRARPGTDLSGMRKLIDGVMDGGVRIAFTEVLTGDSDYVGDVEWDGYSVPEGRWDDDAEVQYEPYLADGTVGLRCIHLPTNGSRPAGETRIYLNPSGGSDDDVPTVFVYQGSGDPAADAPDDHHVIEFPTAHPAMTGD